MNRGIVKVSDVLKDFRIDPKPVENRAPAHIKPPKVIGDPTRIPVNRQTAMLISRRPDWLTQPLPPEKPRQDEIAKLREENAKLTATNQTLVAQNSALRRRVERLTVLAKTKPKAEKTEAPAVVAPVASEKSKVLERLKDGI